MVSFIKKYIKIIILIYINYILLNNFIILKDIINFKNNPPIYKFKYINKTNLIKLTNDMDYLFIIQNYKPNNIIHINSNGGDVYEGLDMIKFIKANNISCYAERAYSMAFTIFQHCKERYITRNTKLMQHQPYVKIEGILLDVIKKINKFKELSDSINIYEAKKININYEKYLNKINKKDYYFTKNDFKNYKMADYYIHILN